MVLTALADLLASELFKHLWVLPGLGPAGDPLLFRQKWTKPLTPPSGHIRREGRNYGGRTNSLRSDKARREFTSVHPEARTAGVGKLGSAWVRKEAVVGWGREIQKGICLFCLRNLKENFPYKFFRGVFLVNLSTNLPHL
jgi:hypothetical protein